MRQKWPTIMRYAMRCSSLKNTSSSLESRKHLDEESRKCLTANTPYGTFEWQVVPFAIHNAPAAFSAMMTGVQQEKLNQRVGAYVDDVFVCGETLEEHCELLERTVQRLEFEVSEKVSEIC
mmetsp:Transcript_12541/g.33480  ORF Transcript_12541/g.33480 Transcript_12541/m.33480 type:complete len:121 (-) Transcript_12541:282-644(-)